MPFPTFGNSLTPYNLVPTPAPPLRSAGLAAAGVALLGLAFLALSAGFFGGPAWATWLGYALGAAGVVCHAAALRQSLQRWQMTGRPPRTALVYAALGVAALGWWASGPAREAAFYRANPDATSAEFAGDGIDVRDARGRWHVPFTGCPAAVGASSMRSHNGIVEVFGADGQPVMRLHVDARRAECL